MHAHGQKANSYPATRQGKGVTIVFAKIAGRWVGRLLAGILLGAGLLGGLLAARTALSAQPADPDPTAATPPSPAEERQAPTLLLAGRPRALRLRIESEFPEEFAQMRAAVTARAATAPADQLADLLVSAALLDAPEAEGTHRPMATALLRRALDRLRASPEPELAMHVSLAFAWLHPRLTDEERSSLAQSVLALAEEFDRRAGALDPLEPERPVTEGAALLLARSLLQTSEAPRGQTLYGRGSDRWLSDLLPALARVADDDGGLPGGPVRSSLSAEAVAYALELLSRDTGTDYVSRHAFLRGSYLYHCYSRLAGPEGFLPFDDTAGRGAARADRRLARILPLLAARFGDGVLQQAAIRQRPSDPTRLWPHFLWFDPKLKPAGPPDWPLAYHFERLGLVVARSRWTEDATVLGFRAGPQLFSTQHDDPGGLLLYHRGWLLPAPAVRDLRNRNLHNTLALWSPVAGLHISPSARRGGALTGGAPSRIVAFETGPHFTYLAADLSSAFSGRLKSAIRHVLLVPDPTAEVDVVVVCDIVEPGADAEDVRPVVLFHWPSRPEWESFDQVLTLTTGATRTFCVLEAPLRATAETKPVRVPVGVPGLPPRLFRTVIRADEPSTAELFVSIFCITDGRPEEVPVSVYLTNGALDRFEVEMDWKARTCLVAFGPDGSPGGFIYLEDVVADEVILERRLSSTVQPQSAESLLGQTDTGARATGAD